MTKVLFEINKNSLENNIIKYNKAHTDNFFVEEEINQRLIDLSNNGLVEALYTQARK